MKFVFTDKKINLPNKVHAYAEKKVGKLDRYFKADTEAAMVFSVEKGRNNVELTIRSGGTIIRVAESTSDMFATIDAAVSSVERRLRRNKTRLEKRLRQDAFTRSVDAEEVSSFAPVSDEEEYRIVRTKRFPIKPMTVDEAILQMDLLGHTFYAFDLGRGKAGYSRYHIRCKGYPAALNLVQLAGDLILCCHNMPSLFNFSDIIPDISDPEKHHMP